MLFPKTNNQRTDICSTWVATSSHFILVLVLFLPLYLSKMTAPLTYPSLKCVLESLEANKRFRLAARSPTISRINKAVSLHLSLLRFEDSEIKVNDITYKFSLDSSYARETKEENLNSLQKRLEGGDIILGTESVLRSFKVVRLTYSSSYGSFTKVLAEDVTKEMAMRQLACSVLEGRKRVNVATLKIDNRYEKVLRIPKNLKLHVRSLRAYVNDLNAIAQILDPECFPLESIETSLWFRSYLDNDVIQSSQKLILNGLTFNHSITQWYEILLKLEKHRNVETRNLCFSGKQVRAIIRKVVDNGHSIERTLDLKCYDKFDVSNLMRKIKNKFNGTLVVLQKSKDHQPVSDVVRVPMNSESELIVYAFKVPEKKKNSSRNLLKLEVLPIGSSTPKVEKRRSLKILEWLK
ncbi:hypothetical protein GCK72_007252 [Caenorhabditis remanei]|uniref:DUF38 domain-containing protein n=1 Tax=Caenorhabditis remanei TaxID=31234 RepID=A0A6A5HLN9_CAERE|nr:hypothetical protein GCK72_007252 [Caenorhabditis remanei]KAF1767293.1 hypothetical protein GCK72_007252 [Caenorhabditis remanei]